MADQLSILRSQIDRANTYYYRTGQAMVSDATYDNWKATLKRLCPTDERFSAVGPQYSDEEIRTKVKHNHPRGSLDNVDNGIDGFAEWLADLGNKPVVASYKLDGSNITLDYEWDAQQDCYKLVRALTRGNGSVGEEITANAVLFQGVFTALPALGECINTKFSIGGEGLLYKVDFEELTADDETACNPRNTGNGIVMRKDGTESQLIRFRPYSLLQDDELDITVQYDTMTTWGFDVVDHKLCKTAAEVVKFYTQLLAKRDSLPFEIDGAVAILNSAEARLTYITDDPKTRLHPKYACAIKPPSQCGTTTLIGVNLTVGHTGAIIPTGIVEPIDVCGVTITNVHLSNWNEIEDVLDVAIGDTVSVARAQDVIPKLVDVVDRPDNRKPIPQPKTCPACNSPVTRMFRGKPHANHFCTNKMCPGIQIAKIRHWIGTPKKGLGIKGIGDTFLAAMFDSGKVKDAADLYRLVPADISGLKSDTGTKLGLSRATSIVESIDSKREIPLASFLGALGVDLLGARRAKLMIEGADGQLDTIENWLDDKLLSEIKFKGFGAVQRAAIRAGIDECRPLIERLFEAGVTIMAKKAKVAAGSSPVAGRSFCWTGTRELLQDVEAAGGVVKSGVSKGLEFLVQRDATSLSGKTQKALSYGTKIICVDHLRRVLAGEETLE